VLWNGHKTAAFSGSFAKLPLSPKAPAARCRGAPRPEMRGPLVVGPVACAVAFTLAARRLPVVEAATRPQHTPLGPC